MQIGIFMKQVIGIFMGILDGQYLLVVMVLQF